MVRIFTVITIVLLLCAGFAAFQGFGYAGGREAQTAYAAQSPAPAQISGLDWVVLALICAGIIPVMVRPRRRTAQPHEVSDKRR